MFEDGGDYSSPAKQRIEQLLSELKLSDYRQTHSPNPNPTPAQSPTEPSPTESHQISQMQQSITHKYTILHEKVDTAIAMINQLERERSELADYKRKLRLTAQFEDHVEEIRDDAEEFYGRMERDLEEVQARLGRRMLEVKLVATECEEKAKHDLHFCATELLPFHVDRLRKNEGREKDDLEVKELEYTNKLKGLKRDINESASRNKSELKKAKSTVLQAFERTLADIEKEQNSLKQSFQLHFRTLQKIVASISDKIE